MLSRLSIALGLAALAACTQEVPLQDQRDDPILSDEDLDNAAPLPTQLRSFGLPGARDLAMPALSSLPNRDTMRPMESLVPSFFRFNPALFKPEGKLAYIETFSVFRFRSYTIRLATARPVQFRGKLVYFGRRRIESVATSVDGELMTFSARTAAGDYDVFLLDVGGLFGATLEVYTLGSTTDDELSVSMSLDGQTHVWQGLDPASGTTNYTVGHLDRETGAFDVDVFNITVGGIPIAQNQPSVTGDGGQVHFVDDSQAALDAFGAPTIVRFATDGSAGALVYNGTAGQTTQLADPSATFDGSRVLFRETFAGTNFVISIAPALNEFAVILANTEATHPYITADGTAFAYADGRQIFKAPIDGSTPARPMREVRFARSTQPVWAKELPPPPEGTIVYSDTTAGGPTFSRPDAVGPGLAPDIPYHDFAFTSTAAGFHNFRSAQDYDGYLHLYAAPFDPDQPLVNLIAGNDDLGNNRTSGFEVLLEADTDYVVVTSGFAASDTGNFTNTITPLIPGPGEAPLILAATESLRVAAPGQEINYSFFVATSDPIDCVINFGDGSQQTMRPCAGNEHIALDHTYAADGVYTITISAVASGGTTSEELFTTVHTNDPNRFDIVVVFGGGLSAGQRAAFQIAADRWSEVIVGDLGSVSSGSPELPAGLSCLGEPGFNGFVDDLVISATGVPIDGANNILGQALPCAGRAFGTNGALFPLPTYGAMQFDIADLDSLESGGGLNAVILHEMGHVLGIGTLWRANDLLSGTEAEGFDPNSPDYDPRYHGQTGINAFNLLLANAGRGSEASVPAANTGGPGTREGHWRDLTFDDELMTGFLSIGDNPLSIQTIGGLADLGYAVDLAAADSYALPPAGALLFRRPSLGYDIVHPARYLNKK